MSKHYILEACEAHDYAPLLSWFESDEAFTQWAGPKLARPGYPEDLQKSLEQASYQSYALRKKANKDLVGFGQLQMWPKRAHLGRLAINPDLRGQSLSYVLVNQLIEEAVAQAPIKSLSLFVYSHNTVAIRAYENLGFSPCAYPKNIKPIKDCVFMTMAY